MKSKNTLMTVAYLILVPCAMMFSVAAVSGVHTTSVTKTISAGSDITFENSTHCGSGICYSKFATLTVNDSITSYFGTSGNECESVVSTIEGPLNHGSYSSDLALLYDVSGNTYNWTTFDLDVIGTRTYKLTNKYYNCD